MCSIKKDNSLNNNSGMLVKSGNIARKRELEYSSAYIKQVLTFLKPFGSFKPIFWRQLGDIGEIGGYCWEERVGIPISLSKSKASSGLLKTKIWNLQTNHGDPKLFKLKGRNHDK